MMTTMFLSGAVGAPSDDFILRVTTDNPGLSASNEFNVTVTNTNGNGYNVDCDDDGVDEATGVTGSGGYLCVYPSAGTYTVRIKDNNGNRKGFRRIRYYFDSTTVTDAPKIVEIVQWGTAIWSSMSQAYRGAVNLERTPSGAPDLSDVTSLKQMFQACTVAEINTSDWNVSTISNFSSMFRDTNRSDPDTSGWETSAATNMSNMFDGTQSADPDTSGWETSGVTDMSGMFQGAQKANPDTSAWDTSGVTEMQNMFRDTPEAVPDTSGWETSGVTNMSGMFYGAQKADPDVSRWDTSGVTLMQNMFRNTPEAVPDTSGWDTSRVTRMDGIFQGAQRADPDTSGWDTSQVLRMNNMFRDAPEADPDVSGFNTAKVTTFYGMFYGAVKARPITVTQGDIWNTAAVTDMAYMFDGASRADPDTSGWDTSSVTTMKAMFKDARVAAPQTGDWNTSSVTNMRAMFRGAGRADPDVGDWDTSAVTTMLAMFEDAAQANPDVVDWNVSNVTNMSSMFQNAGSFDRNLRKWNVERVTNFTNFLAGAKLSTYNYDALLNGWVGENLQSGLTFDAGESTYCKGEQARSDIIANAGWTIKDGGKHCPAPCEEVFRPLRAYHWTLVSFPCDTGSNGVEDLLRGTLGTYGDSADWVMYEQTGTFGSTTPKRRLEANDTVEPGKGYWIISAADANMTIDSTLPGLAFTSEMNASDLGISDPDFTTVHRRQLPDSDSNEDQKVMLGNPFPLQMHLENVYFSHGSADSGYHPMNESNDSAVNPNAPYIAGVVYTYDKNSTSAADYIAITPTTPGFEHHVDPMTGFFSLIRSGESGSNYMAYPLEE